MTNAGVIYSIHGRFFWPQLVVSVYSLRKHYKGPVCIMALDDAGYDIACKISEHQACKHIDIVRPHVLLGGRNSGYTTKPKLPPLAPYTHGVFLDADTLITNKFFAAMLPSGNEEVTLTKFSSWTTLGPRINGRVSKWEHCAPEEVHECRSQAWPAVNTGVYGFVRDSEFFQKDWPQMTMRNADSFICDEIAAQLLVPKYVREKRMAIQPDTFNCFTPDVSVSGNFTAGAKAFYRGKVTEIVTKSGRRITLTPNHPVFTNAGLIPASQVNRGHKLVTDDVYRKANSARNCDNANNTPALAEDVFKTFSLRGSHTSPLKKFTSVERRLASTNDFHGDGEFVDGNIEIIRSNISLLNDGVLLVDKPRKRNFVRMDSPLSFKHGLCSLALCLPGVLLSSPGGFHGVGHLFDRLTTLPFVSLDSGVGRIAKNDPMLPQTFHDRSGRAVKFASQSLSTFSRQVASSEQLNRRQDKAEVSVSSLGGGLQNYSTTGKSLFDNTSVASKFAGHTSEALARRIASDEVISVRQIDFAGHVYDFTEANGCIIANGVLVSNCSPLYGEARQCNPAIWHFHGGKHLRPGLPRDTWWPVYNEARALNVAGIADWATDIDPQLAI